MGSRYHASSITDAFKPTHCDSTHLAAAPLATGPSATMMMAAPTRFRFNPYSNRCAVVPLFESGSAAPTPSAAAQMPSVAFPAEPVMMTRSPVAALSAVATPLSELPRGTLHIHLAGRACFVPYPTEEFVFPEAQDPLYTDVSAEGTVRLFIGQLPYHVTDMQLNWLCYTFGDGHRVHNPERIMKKQPNSSERLPTGCIHAYCHPNALTPLVNGIHKRLLVDDTGVWYAVTEGQVAALESYVQKMKRDKSKRYAHRPYDTMVIQRAHSTFVPKTFHAQAHACGFSVPLAASAKQMSYHQQGSPAQQQRCYAEEGGRRHAAMTPPPSMEEFNAQQQQQQQFTLSPPAYVMPPNYDEAL